MIILLLSIIPTVLLFLMLKTKMLYKILLSLVFYVVFPYIVLIFAVIMSNLHSGLIDKIGYCPVTDFTQNLSNISGILFEVFFAIILFIAYKRQNKKLFKRTILILILFILCLIIKFTIASIHFYLIDTVGYSNFYTKILTLFDNYIISVILTVVLYLYLRKYFLNNKST